MPIIRGGLISSDVWGDAYKAQWRIQRDISPLFERFMYLAKLQWADIECDSYTRRPAFRLL